MGDRPKWVRTFVGTSSSKMSHLSNAVSPVRAAAWMGLLVGVAEGVRRFTSVVPVQLGPAGRPRTGRWNPSRPGRTRLGGEPDGFTEARKEGERWLGGDEECMQKQAKRSSDVYAHAAGLTHPLTAHALRRIGAGGRRQERPDGVGLPRRRRAEAEHVAGREPLGALEAAVELRQRPVRPAARRAAVADGRPAVAAVVAPPQEREGRAAQGHSRRRCPRATRAGRSPPPPPAPPGRIGSAPPPAVLPPFLPSP